MQQDDFIRAQSAQAQADQGQTQQQNPNTQSAYMQDPNSQHHYMQNPPTQNPNAQTPSFYNQNQNQNRNQYMQQHPSAQNAHAQHPQGSASQTPNPGDFLHDGHTYNIHRLHQLIDARHPNSPPHSNRGANAFSLPSHGAYGPHNAPPRPEPRLGPNGRPMIELEHFGHHGEWVEMPDPQAYRRDTEENRAERERHMVADVEFIERNPHRLGATWRPVWKRW